MVLRSPGQLPRIIRSLSLALVLWMPVNALCGTFIEPPDGSSDNESIASQSRRAVDLRDFYRIESIGNPAISPDGKVVAFVRSTIIEAENRRNSEIWLAPSDGGSAPKRLTDPSMSCSNPRWSPDGKLLSFSAARRRGATNGSDDSSPVWFMKMDQSSGEPFQIQGVGGAPIFSPDNQWIAFTKRTPATPAAQRQYASDFEKTIEQRFKGHIFDWMEYRFDQRGYLPDPRDPAATPPGNLASG